MANDVCPAALQLEEGGGDGRFPKNNSEKNRENGLFASGRNSSSSAVIAFAKAHSLTFRAAHVRSGEQAVKF